MGSGGISGHPRLHMSAWSAHKGTTSD
eukprot:gene27017-biopygen17585